MVTEQIAQTKTDELNRCKDLAAPINEDQTSNGSETEPMSANQVFPQTRFEGFIHEDQNVNVTGDQSVGQVSKLLPGAGDADSYLVVRTPHFWGQNKMVPIELVDSVNPNGVQLSIGLSEFQELPKYQTDAELATEVESALWNDEVLRVTDYHEVHVRVINGVIFLNGYITGVMNQGRIENAVATVQGSLGVKFHLISDDNLILQVSEALVQIQRVEGNSVFAHVQNGVVTLSGNVISAEIRSSAEQCAANVAWVRGVINNLAAPEVDPKANDPLFVQPTIGEKIYFRDSLEGIITQVVINPKNKRVTAMIMQGQFPDEKSKSGSMSTFENLAPERLAVIPVGLIRFLTEESGFLLIDSTETSQYQIYDPTGFVVPNADWVPPYPYCTENVRFLA